MYTLTCETQQTRWHSPNRLPRTRRHSPNHLPRTRQTGGHSPSRLPSTRHTRRHLPKAIFEKNVTRLDKFAQVTCESCEFGVSGHSLISIQIFNYFFTNSSKHLIKFLAAIKNNQRPKTFHFRLKKLHKRKIIQLSAVRTAESWKPSAVQDCFENKTDQKLFFYTLYKLSHIIQIISFIS